jgi:hypothetical protein
MSKEDRAIVVGISKYPDLGDLRGPENDAHAFRDWLVDTRGGDVPDKQIRMILSSDTGPLAAAPGTPHPTVIEVQKEFEALQDIADENMAAQRGRRVGRRLYLYLAGHGFSPSTEQTALLMANAAPLRAGGTYHIIGQFFAGWFYRAGYFDEICLFMDCCREIFTATSLNMPWADEVDETAIDRCRFFYAFGTKWSQDSRERPMPPDDLWHGVFTSALLAGLRGAAVEPGDPRGRITAESLEAYLLDYMQDFLSEPDRSNPDVAKAPDVDFKPRRPPGQMVIAEVPPDRGVGQRVLNFVRGTEGDAAKYAVTIAFDTALRGKTAQVIQGLDGTTVVATSKSVGAEWSIKLERARYLAKVDGTADKVFEVTGVQEVTRVEF